MIRRYTPADLEDLLDAWAKASAVAHPFLTEEFLQRERHEIANAHLPRAETWVWETEGRVVGFLSLIGNEVGALFVDPSHHGMGIGRALMDQARESRGELEVEVFRANLKARAFYERYGFATIGERIHGPTGQLMVRMRLSDRGRAILPEKIG
jgi:putative acetyltransferase